METESRVATRDRPRGNVWRLAAAQALAGANSAVIFATGSIIGSILAPSPAYATAPISIFTIGMAAGTLPCGAIARLYGRRAAFLAGCGCGAAAGLVAAAAIVAGSFWAFCAATFLGGLYAAVVQSFRFAAADGVEPAYRPKALSWVMAGGIFAGFLGPQLVTWTMDLWAPYVFAASYVAQAGVAVLSAIVLAGVDLPPPPRSAAGGRPIGIIIRQPLFVTAAICGTISYALMNLLMTSAPLAMHFCGLPVSASNLAIQWHIVAMYGPSFFTGSLIARFGAGRVVAAGLLLIVVAALVGLAGLSAAHFVVALILLGLGWNFGFVGASALVLQTHRPEERTKVQAFNDFLVFGVVACGSFASGRMLVDFGWAVVNMAAFPLAALALATLVAAAWRRTRVETRAG